MCRKRSQTISSSDVGYKKFQANPWDICQATSRKIENVGNILMVFLNSDIATDINQIET
jgi:hypothetical protein